MAVIVAVFDVRKVRMTVLDLAMPVWVLVALGQMQVQTGRHQHAGAPEPRGSGFMEQAQRDGSADEGCGAEVGSGARRAISPWPWMAASVLGA